MVLLCVAVFRHKCFRKISCAQHSKCYRLSCSQVAASTRLGAHGLLLYVVQKAEDILTPEGVMEVWLLEAQNVPKMDFFGSGQPYGKYAPDARKRYTLNRP